MRAFLGRVWVWLTFLMWGFILGVFYKGSGNWAVAEMREAGSALATVPWWCWASSAVVLYLAVMWLIVGPRETRSVYRDHRAEYARGSYPPLPVIWFLTPIWWPFFTLSLPLCWLIYGTIGDE